MTKRLILALGLLLAGLSQTRGSQFYSKDAGDSWNRVYDALLVRTNSTGMVYDDLVDPPLWFRTQHLVDDASCQRVTKLLRDFSADDAALASKTPAHCAFMQRDLFGVFSWLIDGHRGDSGRMTGAQREFARALARAIRHVALDEGAIRKLPSNLAADSAAPGQFDPAQPDRPFLPKDLLADDGSWIAVEPQGDDWMPATVHFKYFRGRSAFEVRFHHPGGRAAGEAYLRELAAFPKPIVFEKPGRGQRFAGEEGPWLNPATPLFPTNSAWALVRRAILADREGRPVLSPIVESVQIRVYRRTDRPAFREVVTASGAVEPEFVAQKFLEWHVSRDFLRGGVGLRPSDPVIAMYAHHFMSKQFDPFEEGWPLPEAGSSRARLDCQTCHDGPGLESVHSRSRMFELGMVVRPPELKPVSLDRISQIAEIEARQMPLWQLLPWLQTKE